MKLKNEKYANGSLQSSFGILEFDEKGYVVKPELSEEAVKAFAELSGFIVEATEKAQEPKKKEKEEVVKEEVKEPEKEAEEAPKRKRKSSEK